MEAGKFYLNNHVDFTISYHESPEFEVGPFWCHGPYLMCCGQGSRVVGVEVRPRSIKHSSLESMDCSLGQAPLEFVASNASALTVIYSYSVAFKYSGWFLERWVMFDELAEIKWASRWDVYLQSSESSVHWFSIVNSVIIVLFLSGMIGVILTRTLHRDIARYNQVWPSPPPSNMAHWVQNDANMEEAAEEFGWKLIHGDVFRAPSSPMAFAVIIGNGTQARLLETVLGQSSCCR